MTTPLQKRIDDAIHRAAPLPAATRARIAEAVRDELADDLTDDDAPPEDDGLGALRITVGAHVITTCPACGEEQMFTLPTYTAINDGIARIGEVAICTGCLWSPHGGGGAVNDDD